MNPSRRKRQQTKVTGTKKPQQQKTSPFKIRPENLSRLPEIVPNSIELRRCITGFGPRPVIFPGPFLLLEAGTRRLELGAPKLCFSVVLSTRSSLTTSSSLILITTCGFNQSAPGSGSDGQVGPSPRAFHVAVAIDCHMFIFGGRSSGKRLGDFWVLDTDIWQWSELTSFGDLPSAQDFAAASAIGNQKIVMYGGWDEYGRGGGGPIMGDLWTLAI
ncbi:hypothetical protein MLD38_008598 [Melastoma candidum]|uniref:Uncharacterized protein n=1 Tax=Melastoma candidum TaxID=119954 RepID=A0ACB9RUJ0_9MYRT|nr:hypothetical protein MLD38_008598 [Melastoma candidum]